MPKKRLQSTKHEDEGEKRPQQITLGCFIKPAKARGKAQTEKQSDSFEGKQTPHCLGASLPAQAATHDSNGLPDGGARQESERLLKTSVECTSSAAFEEGDEETGFKVMRTKKGGFPIYLEKRAKGKKVTVVRQVSGNSKSLLQTLKTKFGTGGLVKPGEVEIQGDFEEKLIKYFKENTHFLVQYNSRW